MEDAGQAALGYEMQQLDCIASWIHVGGDLRDLRYRISRIGIHQRVKNFPGAARQLRAAMYTEGLRSASSQFRTISLAGAIRLCSFQDNNNVFIRTFGTKIAEA